MASLSLPYSSQRAILGHYQDHPSLFIQAHLDAILGSFWSTCSSWYSSYEAILGQPSGSDFEVPHAKNTMRCISRP